MDTFCLSQVQSMAVIGGSSKIGLAIIENILARQPRPVIFTTYRSQSDSQPLLQLQKQYPEQLRPFCCDPSLENEWEGFSKAVSEHTDQLQLILNCVGTLHDKIAQPEKSILQVSSESLAHIFKINTSITALMAKHLFPFCRGKKLTLIASLSAKVGSIGDNHLGGWYSYRASKAALNMILKTLALEFKNRNIPAMTLAIHPGTTTTPLSKPYTQRTRLKLHTPAQTAQHILEVIEQKTLSDTGKFYNWDDSELAW